VLLFPRSFIALNRPAIASRSQTVLDKGSSTIAARTSISGGGKALCQNSGGQIAALCGGQESFCLLPATVFQPDGMRRQQRYTPAMAADPYRRVYSRYPIERMGVKHQNTTGRAKQRIGG
jgi:hypothetical protein